MATGERTLSNEAFMQEVTQRGLDVKGPASGYFYAGYQGPRGWEVIRTQAIKRVFWSFRQVCTQDNVAGGSLIATITPAANTAMRCTEGRQSIAASGTRAVSLRRANADGVLTLVNSVGAAAGASAVAPILASAAGTSGANLGNAGIIANPEYLYGIVESAAQTETATLMVSVELIGTETAPTVSWAGSAGTPNVAAATENVITVVYE